MKRRTEIPPALRGRAFSHQEGLAEGVTRARMRGDDLARPYHGIRSQPLDPTDPLSHVRAYLPHLNGEQFFSHTSAALIHGLPLPLRLAQDPRVHVSTRVAGLRHGGRGVVGHHVQPDRVRVVAVNGLPVTAPVDTWCQMSTLVSLDALIALGDALVRRKRPLATMDELRAGVVCYTGKRGAKRLREAFTSVRPRTDSAKETATRLVIVRAGLPEPEVNGEIFDRLGRKIATGDLVFRGYRILVEYDGEQHRMDEEQYHWDVDRLDAIMEAGWRVIRINKSHLRRSPSPALQKITTALTAAGWRP
jgi:very-short-patch-repair endonuclease